MLITPVDPKPRRTLRILSVLAVLGVLAACAPPPSHVTLELSPQLWINAPLPGSEGRSIYFQFEDRRSLQEVGINRPNNHHQILLSDSVLSVQLYQQLSGAFSQLGYTVSTTPDQDYPLVTVQLLELWYEVDPDNSRKIVSRSRLAVSAKSGTQTYRNIYSYEAREELLLLPRRSGQTERLNTALGAVLKNVALDTQLLAFLNNRSDG